MNDNTIFISVATLAPLIDAHDATGSLSRLAGAYDGLITFSTSFGIEDQVITHMIGGNALPVAVFTLDTGRLFAETYSTWSATVAKYGIPIAAYYPNAEPLQDFVAKNGPNSFYESVALRLQCCHLRKVEPLQRALAGKKIWVTGIRAGQSPNRQNMPILEYDATHDLIKYHPLLHWTQQEVEAYAAQHGVPVNPLHGRGFVSIGCAPCTRALKPGEDFRAGRWWWEDANSKECGLHAKP
ncbi:MAG: phosphoadenylyl-sulfate reductase [Bacteroidetes bacterium]|nr:MAG: phosphoadenylyl-sulfate reductase [Bacteroidota bacterium]